MPGEKAAPGTGSAGVHIGFGEHDEISASAFYQAGDGRLRRAFLVVSPRACASGVPAAPIRRSMATSTGSTGTWSARSKAGGRKRPTGLVVETAGPLPAQPEKKL